MSFSAMSWLLCCRLSCLVMAIYAGYMYICDRARFNELSVPISNALSRNCGGEAGQAVTAALVAAPITEVAAAPITEVVAAPITEVASKAVVTQVCITKK